MNTRTFHTSPTFAVLACLACIVAGVALGYAAIAGGGANADTAPGRSVTVSESFEGIHFRGGAAIEVRQIVDGDARIDLSATDDVLRHVKIEVLDGTLVVAVDDDDVTAEDLLIEITTPHELSEIVSLGAVALASEGLRTAGLSLQDRGAGSYRFKAFSAEELLIEARGASRFRIDGEVGRQVVDIAGAGSYEAPALRSRTAEISLRGAGQANVHASETLTVRISGAGMVQYAGGARVEERIFGAGMVQKRDDA